MIQRRAYRWTFFAVAVFCFWYAVFEKTAPWAVVGFFAAGGIWFWLERRKTRELDAPRPK